MINHLTRFLREAHIEDAHLCKQFYGTVMSYYLVTVYLLIKLLYIANVIGQIFFMNKFLDTEYHWYGLEVLRNLGRDDVRTTSERFPRVTLCDFNIRVLGNIQRYTVSMYTQDTINPLKTGDCYVNVNEPFVHDLLTSSTNEEA